MKEGRMFSFIVIGRNEGNNLISCFESCKRFAIHNHIVYEIIFVDSQSTDNSIEIANSFGVNNVLSLEAPCNAAKARNLGASSAKGDYFVFVDGDMILYPEFGKGIINEGKPIYPFINGQRIDIFYDEQGKYLGDNINQIQIINKDTFQITTGGLFIISKSLWYEVNGMDPKLNCFEDNDLAYRIYRFKNIKILNVGKIFAEHHTVNYTNKKRYLKLAIGNYFFYKGVILRKHLFSRMFPHLIIKNISFSILIISIILSVIFQHAGFFVIYFIAMLTKLFFIKKSTDTISILARFFIDIYIDLKILFGLLFFYPKSN